MFEDTNSKNGTSASPCNGGNFLTRELLQKDRELLAEIRRREAVDLALYAFARQQMMRHFEDGWRSGRSVAEDPPLSKEGSPDATEMDDDDGLLAQKEIDPSSKLRRDWADDFVVHARRLQRLTPPTERTPILFTHIPKCAGSTFRNHLLLEFTRLNRELCPVTQM
jgi:hypothetical protein